MRKYQVRFWRAAVLVRESLTLIVNAARNILQKGLCTVGHTGTYAWGDLPAGLVGEILPGDGESMFAPRCVSKPRIP